MKPLGEARERSPDDPKEDLPQDLVRGESDEGQASMARGRRCGTEGWMDDRSTSGQARRSSAKFGGEGRGDSHEGPLASPAVIHYHNRYCNVT